TPLRAEGIPPACRCYGRSDRGQCGKVFPVSARPSGGKVSSTQRHERLDDHWAVIRIAPALHLGPGPTHPSKRIIHRLRPHRVPFSDLNAEHGELRTSSSATGTIETQAPRRLSLTLRGPRDDCDAGGLAEVCPRGRHRSP